MKLEISSDDLELVIAIIGDRLRTHRRSLVEGPPEHRTSLRDHAIPAHVNLLRLLSAPMAEPKRKKILDNYGVEL